MLEGNLCLRDVIKIKFKKRLRLRLGLSCARVGQGQRAVNTKKRKSSRTSSDQQKSQGHAGQGNPPLAIGLITAHLPNGPHAASISPSFPFRMAPFRVKQLRRLQGGISAEQSGISGGCGQPWALTLLTRGSCGYGAMRLESPESPSISTIPAHIR